MILTMLMAAHLISQAPAMSAAPHRPLIIAHRGASGERPEHTRAAYLRAIDQGADVIEPDLVMTRDGHLVVRHENEIGGTTNIGQHPEFAARYTTRLIDGQDVTGWFTEDFTLDELKTLKARERLPDLRPGSAAYDEQEDLLTFDHVLDIAEASSQRLGRPIAVAPEIKHPAYFQSLGLDIEEALIEVLERRGQTGEDAAILIQCFEVGPLQRLSQRIQTPLLQLMQSKGGPADRPDLTYAEMATPEGLHAIAAYADQIGVETTMILPRDDAAASLAPTSLVIDAHEAGLEVVVWTLRAENHFLPLEYRSNKSPSDHGDLTGYARRFSDLGADALFTDFPGLFAPSPR
jgi:glycerophosphoryl diester phosphodiesterase